MRHAVLMPVLLFASVASADPRVLYCRAGLTTGTGDGSSWANAFRGSLALRDALAVAQSGDQIWVAEGTYKPAASGGPTTSALTLVSGVSVLGGFAGSESAAADRVVGAHPSVLSGDLNGNDSGTSNTSDNSNRVITALNPTAGTQLDLFTIKASKGVTAGDAFGFDGGGLAISGGTMLVTRCTFAENKSDGAGGGAVALNSAAVFEDCTFDGNRARWGCNLAGRTSSILIVRRCRFVGDSHVTGGTAGVGILSGWISGANDSSQLVVEDSFFSIAENEFSCPTGMGIYASKGTADIRGCDFINNKGCGGGAGVSGEAVVNIDRCRFIGNEASADGGAAIHTFHGVYTITNSLFHANSTRGFSTLQCGGNFRIVNCTFTNNGSTGFNNYTIMSNGAGTSLENCILWGNLSRQGIIGATAFNNSTPPRFDRCLVEGWNGTFPGTGTFSANPLFVDPDGPDNVLGSIDDNLRLLPGSPAIDRGNNAAIAAQRDLAALPRFRQDPNSPDLGLGAAPFVDLGAYEFQPACPADFNGDGFLDGFDYDAFVSCFEGDACPPGKSADYNGDGFADGFDYDDFVAAFETGCP